MSWLTWPASRSPGGPEFLIHNTTTALARTNFAYEVVYRKMPIGPDRPLGTWLDLTPLVPLAGNPSQLIELVNLFMLHGTMTPAMREVITASVAAIPASQSSARVQNAVYLVATSPQYLIER
jgi:hypothetical protein